MNLSRNKQRGLSLPELMVAILLGTIVTTAVIGMYLSTSRNFSQDERYALMQENGRYALRILAEDLSMTDFWGKVTAPDSVRNTAGLTTSGSCAADTPPNGIDLLGNLTAATTALLYNNNHTGGTSHFTVPAGCTAITANQLAGTDLLVVKRVKGMSETGLSAGVVRIRVSGAAGEIVNTGTPGADETDWVYMPRIYFIRDYFDTPGDGIPSLCRMDLVNDGGPAMGKLDNPDDASGTADDVNCIAEGIEDMHVQFGIDTDFDGIANQYKSSPTLAEMEGAVSARVYLLARTSSRDPYFTDSKTFILGDVTLTQADLTGTNYYRRVFTTTVMLRNAVNLNLLNN